MQQTASTLSRLEIVMKIGTHDYTMTRRGSGTVTLLEIIEFIAAQQRKPAESLQNIELRCSGCHRRLWVMEEDYQPVPVPCCRVRSLILEETKSEDLVADGTENVSLVVSLPGAIPTPISVPISLSIDGLLKTLLNGRPRLPIADVRSSGSGSLSTVTAEWRNLTLRECGATNGDHFTLQTAAPSTVYIMVCEPFSSRPTDSALVHLNPKEWNWKAIRKTAQRHFKVAISSHANASQFVRFYTEESDEVQRRAIWSYREEPETEFYFADEDNSTDVDRSKAPHSVLEFLVPSSGLRWAPHTTPLLQVDTNCVFLCMCDDGDEFDEFDPQDTVFTTKWLVLLLGMRYWSSSGWQNYIRIRGGLIFNQNSGEVFDDIEAVVRSRNRVPKTAWQKFFLFMKDSDYLPRGNVPEGKMLAIYRREGLHLDVEDRRLILRGAESEGSESAWTVPTDKVEFDEKFMKGMRH